ncbi:MAG TPA: ATPase domain-containing protein [Candidatus Angelobacter sp.]|nr:ATPase domain-containing protein [Candidatus Angelobacter sp.]
MKLDSNLEFPILLNRALLQHVDAGNNRIQNNIRVEESEAIYTMAERYELQSQSGKGKMPTVDRTPTGIPGLDEILSGGFPRGRVILLVGGPGTGKTILTSQFLMNGIKIYGENGAFVSLDETKAHYYREMALFGWKFEELEKGKKFAFINASPLRHMPGEVKIGRQSIGRKDFSILSLIEGIKTHTELINAKRVVVDPVTSLIFQYPEMVERRTAILDLVDALVKTGATCLMTTELRAMGPTVERAIQLEEYLAHGVVIMSNAKVGKTYNRVLQVEKMRETPIDMQPRPYKISGNGIEVFPKETIFVD